MAASDPIGIQLIPLAVDYIHKMEGDTAKIKTFFQKDWVPIEILRIVYGSMAEKEFPPIEKIAEEDKKRIWKTINEWVSGDKEHKIKCAKALYLVEQLMDKKIG